MPQIHQSLIAVMRDMEAIGKDKVNQAQKFKFRGIDDIYNAIHPLLAKHGIVTCPCVSKSEYGEMQSKSGGTMVHVKLLVEYDFVAEDGSSLHVGPIASEALDSGDKASNKAMAFAHKYAILQTFCIPTEDVAEGDKDSPKIADKAKKDDSQLYQQLLASIQAAKNHAELEAVVPLINSAKAKLTPIEMGSIREGYARVQKELPQDT